MDYHLSWSLFPLMTKLLQQAIAEISKLSDEQQDAIASRLLDELEDEQAWQARFESTTDSQWDNLAATVRQEIESDTVVPLDEVFPIGQ
ncbi:hypothetical protein PN498_02310 [Oscillatoria sp. CS-180]|uniref:hypothetical protein n=1 Tax=Oscillatoria sp. CS-180 TaxID=3021720 RepID=UPI00232D66E9|nr:hypothetical protein [Oscillatoria sp. CS-180]MDB9524808.1 hypothetical protein [Oscillatoria sp. CS-180]